MNFSRRNATQPLPPSPDRIWIFAWSRNFMAWDSETASSTGPCRFARPGCSRLPPPPRGEGMGRGVPESICEKYFRTCTPLPACARSAQADLPLKGGGVRSELRVLNLRHAAGAAPALERGPDRALEPEAVDRRRAFQRADAVEPDPGPLEPAFLQHPPRGRIGNAGTGLQRLGLEIG